MQKETRNATECENLAQKCSNTGVEKCEQPQQWHATMSSREQIWNEIRTSLPAANPVKQLQIFIMMSNWRIELPNLNSVSPKVLEKQLKHSVLFSYWTFSWIYWEGVSLKFSVLTTPLQLYYLIAFFSRTKYHFWHKKKWKWKGEKKVY